MVFLKWLFLSVFLFAAVNWFLRPTFPTIVQYVPVLNVWSSMGLAGILMILVMFLRK